jgi:hypothetical protein
MRITWTIPDLAGRIDYDGSPDLAATAGWRPQFS